jgi:hypothetical protein
VICLALLPKEKVEDAFIALCEYHRAENEEIDKFLDYVIVNYVDPEEALFPNELWNQSEENDNKRTNNDAEGYKLWLDLWLHQHPNIWNFIKKIKGEESSAN